MGPSCFGAETFGVVPRADQESRSGVGSHPEAGQQLGGCNRKECRDAPVELVDLYLEPSIRWANEQSDAL
jgi:hypothetical protein